METQTLRERVIEEARKIRASYQVHVDASIIAGAIAGAATIVIPTIICEHPVNIEATTFFATIATCQGACYGALFSPNMWRAARAYNEQKEERT